MTKIEPRTTIPPLIDRTRLPTFLIIGAAKAGTTSLHYYLDQHPEIGMSSVKETNFFTREDFMEGLNEYEAFFEPSSEGARGEASPWYTWHPFITGVPARIHSVLPHAKLIYLVRDPVERAVAFYWERFASNLATSVEAAFDDVEDARNLYACASKYALQVEQYLEFFPRSSLMIVDSDDLRDARHQTLKSIFTFLDVDPDFSSPRFSEELNPVSRKLRPTAIGRRLKQSAPAVAIRRTVPLGVRRHLFGPVRRATSHKVKREPLPEEIRRRLEDVLRPDTERFRDFTGRPFETWSV